MPLAARQTGAQRGVTIAPMTGSLIAQDTSPTRPYLVRALYEWCTDNGLTPYVAVFVDDSVQVPREFVKNNEIVLNISFDATSALKLGNDFIEFKARFGGVARSIMVPMDHVLAIYARENGQGMAFPVSAQAAAGAGSSPALSSVPKQLLDDIDSTAHNPQDTEEPGAAPTRVLEAQIIPLNASQSNGPDDPTDPPHPPKSPDGARPSLKRVK
jgi:stringent starvation protein B